MNHLARLLVAASLVTVAACTQSVEDGVESNESSIVGGVEAQEGAWPGTVALYLNSSQVCAGLLVADQWVVTAGHCIINPSSPAGGLTRVVIGRHRLSSTAGETRSIDRVVRHPGYRNLDNDIAVLHLSEPSSAPKGKLVGSTQASLVAAEAMVTAVGWGNTREGGGSSDVLREVSVPVISNEQCKSFPRYNNVTDNMICAMVPEGGKDACQGDSGGPLFQQIDGEWVEVGIVSWGIGCARRDAPGVYTRVGNYLNWLYEVTGGEVGEAPAAPEPPPEAVDAE